MTLIYIITKLGEHGGDFLRVSCDRNVSRSPRALLCDLFGVQISPRGVACRSWKSNGTFDSQNIKRFMDFLWCWCLRHRFADLDDFDVRPIESLVFSRQTLKSRTDPKIRNQSIRDHVKPCNKELSESAARGEQLPNIVVHDLWPDFANSEFHDISDFWQTLIVFFFSISLTPFCFKQFGVLLEADEVIRGHIGADGGDICTVWVQGSKWHPVSEVSWFSCEFESD